MRQLVGVVVAVGVMTGCGPDSAAMLAEDEEGVELAASELNVDVMLQYLNGDDASIEGLVADVGLDRRVSTNIATRVRGADLALGTADDRPLRTLRELDDIPWVGPATIAAIDRFVTARGGAAGTPVVVEGVSFSGPEAASALAVANDARLIQVRLTEYQRAMVEQRRPHADLASLAATPGIGAVALQKFKTFAASLLPPTPAPTPGACAETDGKRDGVFFTAAEACRAVEFLNQARASEMYAMPKAAIDFAWRGGPYRPHGALGRTVWSRLNEFSDAAGIGTGAVSGLLTASRAWQRNGLSYDTVANVWADRHTLKDRLVRFEKVYVKRVLPLEQDPNRPWMGTLCAELRDTPTSSNYLFACQTMIGADSSSGCSAYDCLSNKAGTYVNLRGELNATAMRGTGGYRVNFSVEPTPASPAVP